MKIIRQEIKYQNIISTKKFKTENGGATSDISNPVLTKLFIGQKYNGHPPYPYVRLLENQVEIIINIKNKITFTIVGFKNSFINILFLIFYLNILKQISFFVL